MIITIISACIYLYLHVVIRKREGGEIMGGWIHGSEDTLHSRGIALNTLSERGRLSETYNLH